MPGSAASHKQLLYLNIFWWLIISTINWFVLTENGLTYIEALTDILISVGLLGAVCTLMVNNMRYYLPQREKYWYIFFISLIISALCSLVSKLILEIILPHNVAFMQVLENSAGARFGIDFLLVSCIFMMSLLWYNQEEQKRMNEHRTETEQLVREAELFKLRQQLQPHFLFNSLNSISALTGNQPEKARHMIHQLSEFLRGTLKKEDRQWNSLEEEMQYLQLYLDIEKVRFGYRLQTIVLCDDDALGLELPAMLLQPIVENAIKFGLYDTTGEVCIKVMAKKIDKHLSVTVENPFDPETAQPLKGTGFGIASIQRRLFLLFGRQDLLQTKKEQNLFITSVIIPQNIQKTI